MKEFLDLTPYRKIGLFGGTFNPIHYGHLKAAEAVFSHFNLDKILFIPTGQPPHKNNEGIVHPEHRYLMTALAVNEYPDFLISDIECERAEPSYTIDTIKELKKRAHADTEFFFITGSDAIEHLQTWKSFDKLLSICTFIAVSRKGNDNKEVINKNIDLLDAYPNSILFYEYDTPDISSTEIRDNLRSEKSITGLMPPPVEKYISKNGLYLLPVMSLEDLRAEMEATLSEKRFRHSEGVCDGALSLAGHYGIDKRKAYLAAILHDCAKRYKEHSMIEKCSEHGIIADEYMESHPETAHGLLGAELAKSEYGVYDTDILNAIRYHTTGRPNMSNLEKIIYIADVIDPNRQLDFTEEIRRLAYAPFRDNQEREQNLDRVFKCCLQKKLEYCEENGTVPHPLSLQI